MFPGLCSLVCLFPGTAIPCYHGSATGIIYTIIFHLSVAVHKLQVAILARSSREMFQTVRINCRSFLLRVRISKKFSALNITPCINVHMLISCSSLDAIQLLFSSSSPPTSPAPVCCGIHLSHEPASLRPHALSTAHRTQANRCQAVKVVVGDSV